MRASYRRMLAVGLLTLAALFALGLRRGLVLAFFPDGSPGPAPVLTPAPVDTPTLAPGPPVRVLLIDGLDAATANALPGLSRLCGAGMDLRVDNGFPTVSLPVQHVLWTGLTQDQSGVMYRIPRLETPPAGALPARVPGSIAIAQSHRDIVHSFGFHHVEPAPEAEAIEAPGSIWREQDFATAAVRAVAGDASLVLVHVLDVDEAGHAYGRTSVRYREAAARADALVTALHGQAPHARWFVLSDHGHLDGGGHGGAEPEIRVVRACVVGPGIAPSDHGGDAPVHLVDVHRAIADALGLAVMDGAMGRPLAFALAHPDPGATLPRPGLLEWIVAAVLWLGALAVVVVLAGRRVGAWPWWIVVAYGSVVAIHGVPSLSNPVVYPPLGGAVLLAAAPGALVLALGARGFVVDHGIRRTVGLHLVPPALVLLGVLSLCGGIGRVLGLHSRPPLQPIWTAHASVGLSLCVLGAGVLALIVGAVGRRRP